AARAAAKTDRYRNIAAPRGAIYDRNGKILADNKATFTALLDIRELLRHEESLGATLDAVEATLGIPKDRALMMMQENITDGLQSPVILKEDLSQRELVSIGAQNLSSIMIQNDFERIYTDGPVFAPVVGYVGRVGAADLMDNSKLTPVDFIGKAGIESFYDGLLRGTPGATLLVRDARGNVLSEDKKNDPAVGNALRLTIDSGLQEYFYYRLQEKLRSLGRRVGIGLAINPQTGEVLSMVSVPSYDNRVLSGSGNNDLKARILTSPDKPLFDRIVSGFYNPGSTIKPLDGVAILKEGVVDPARKIYSPGYLLVPNPYDSTKSSRYLDWRPQGNVDLASALAQSSDVYFYITVGGSPEESSPLLNDQSNYGIRGLGISRLYDWWEKFGLGRISGIDMPNEAAGFLPTPEWKQKKLGTPWLLGDTYNVSIGQGDLLLTPIQLLDYVGAIATAGKIYRPFLNSSSTPQTLVDLSDLAPQIKEVQKGMRQTVTSPLGTAHALDDLPFSVCAKTGSAQVQNNSQENAFFVGYAPCEPQADRSQIAILVLIENSVEGSLNAIPVAKDVLNWYIENRPMR
ncbi:MAG: penicillin-binding transpeptidase domain-containing protein, partial [Candidatus Liptonbacteria bacterium]|nr:penicillin-binding transpeptidase domain-containing protein [Candidatus Liptonbacteria bacterium]